MNNLFYQFSATNLQGQVVPMEVFKGKTLLIVNTASNCGFTPQFEGLEKLYQKYQERGFVVLGFPCNQFANQEPGDEKSIAEGCVLNYGVSFPMFSKVNVNGSGTYPLYQYLKKELPGLLGGRIHWNFTKFLVSPEGFPVKRFAPFIKPEKIDRHIARLL